jgi:carboxymethylenebutenolidase
MSPREHVKVSTDAGEMPALLWTPESGTGPGILLLQEIFGVSAYIARRGADLAEAGYVVLAPELYWRLDEKPLDMTDPDVTAKAMGLVQKLDWQTTVTDAVTALEHLRARPEVHGGTGVVGFCFGGGLGFNVAAVSDPDVLVSYYGSSLPNLLHLVPQVRAPSLHHFGLADDFLIPEVVETVRAAVVAGPADVRFETYDGANHAFDNSDYGLHHPEASALAWQRTLEFLHERLPVGDSASAGSVPGPA